jgi:hypothetical protein
VYTAAGALEEKKRQMTMRNNTILYWNDMTQSWVDAYPLKGYISLLGAIVWTPIMPPSEGDICALHWQLPPGISLSWARRGIPFLPISSQRGGQTRSLASAGSTPSLVSGRLAAFWRPIVPSVD